MANGQQKTLVFNSGDAGNHHYHQWPTKEPIGWLHIMHGMAEHGGRYANLAGFLNQQGIMVTAGDHRGHGLTGSAVDSLYHVADNDGWNQMVDDQCQLIGHIATEHDLPLVILGHSMGSFMATHFCQRFAKELTSKQLKGLILSGSNYDAPAAFKVFAGLAKIERLRLGGRKISNLLETLSFGAFNRAFKPNRTEKDWLSRDHRMVDTYIADPMCGGAISTQSWYDFLSGLAQLFTPKALAQIDKELPVYLFSGELDPVGQKGKGVKKFQQILQQIGVEQVDLKLYAEGRHEMINETNRREVYYDILKWLKARF
jgi:alpha-beta hydrolase superfamily lysophospholipase